MVLENTKLTCERLTRISSTVQMRRSEGYGFSLRYTNQCELAALIFSRVCGVPVVPIYSLYPILETFDLELIFDHLKLLIVFPQVKTDSPLQNGIYKTNQLIHISVSNKLGLARDSTVGTYLAKIIPEALEHQNRRGNFCSALSASYFS